MSQNSEPKNNKPRALPIVNIRLTFFSDGNLRYQGIPDDFHQAMRFMNEATTAIAGHFVKGAAENRHDADGKAKKSSIVIAPAGALGKN